MCVKKTKKAPKNTQREGLEEKRSAFHYTESIFVSAVLQEHLADPVM